MVIQTPTAARSSTFYIGVVTLNEMKNDRLFIVPKSMRLCFMNTKPRAGIYIV